MSKPFKYSVTKVVMGKKVPPRSKSARETNADFIRSSKHGLHALMCVKNEYVNSNIQYNEQYPETLDRNQINYLTKLFEEVQEYLEENPLINSSNHRITKPLREKTTNLGKTYYLYLKELSSKNLPTNLLKACQKLIGFILEFVENFHFIDNSIVDIRKIPNRPSDGKLRVLVHEVILNYQKEKQTKKFPSYPYVLHALKSEKNGQANLSERQYFNYKVWLKRGTFYWYIQPKKIGIK
jgi:hypothetical protein